MKQQYIGDVGDYGKYSLLRHFALNGIRIGVNWYHTKDDPSSNDGKSNGYLRKREERAYDPAVYDALSWLAFKEDKCLADVKAADLIPHAIYYEDELATDALNWRERKACRNAWHTKAIDFLSEAELIFADPDTGTTGKTTRKGSDQYADINELAEYYRRGKDVVYYCHRARRTEAAWQEKKTELLSLIPDAEMYVLTFHRGMQRSYIFAIHPVHGDRYRRLIDSFMALPWGKEIRGAAPFSEELVGKENGVCAAFQMELASDAFRHIAGYQIITSYGKTAFGHALYTWDEGERILAKCRNCGKLFLVQLSEYHGLDKDRMYEDYFPVAREKDVDELNRQYDGFSLETCFKGRYLQVTNGIPNWSE